jgi:hypothetical protein
VRNNDKAAALLRLVLIQLWFTPPEISLEIVHTDPDTGTGMWFSLTVIISTSWLLSPALTVLRAFRLI